MLRIYLLALFVTLSTISLDISAGEFSACSLSAKPIDCYVDFITSHSGDESADEALQKALELIETNLDEKTRIELADTILNKTGKHYLPYFPPYLRFYLSGPNHLEIFRLIELKEKGIHDSDLINIILTAKGTYGQIGTRGEAVLKAKGFSPLQIRILSNHAFLKHGDKINIDNLRILVLSKAPENEKLEMIALSNIKNIKLTSEKSELLKELGFSSNQIKVLKYNQLLRAGPSQYSIWKIIQEHAKGASPSLIAKNIAATGWYYTNFNEDEIGILRSFGVSSIAIKAMADRTKEFSADIDKVAKNSEKRNDTENIIWDKTLKYVESYQQNNTLLRGVSANVAKNEDSSLTEVAKNCALQKTALKACEYVPFPLGYGCNALAKNKYDCPI